LAQVARERVKQILAVHEPDPPLPKDIEKELDATKTQIEKRLSQTKVSA
jgi:trimethylamine:corrinoid methyltransferase-like protein